MKTKKLPDKPSELLTVALRDLEVIENTPGYYIDMTQWHNHWGSNTCYVCLAGSVMANSLGIDRYTQISAAYFPCDISYKLYALDYFRQGSLDDAFTELDLEIPEKLRGIYDDDDVINCLNLGKMSQDDRPQWELYMQDLIGILEAEGY